MEGLKESRVRWQKGYVFFYSEHRTALTRPNLPAPTPVKGISVATPHLGFSKELNAISALWVRLCPASRAETTSCGLQQHRKTHPYSALQNDK